ncbi:MAG: DUF4430 domain-containing protein [Clostridia bacterium]|nr:DUF4430 domain-containing protein [Clostridia bacterium]
MKKIKSIICLFMVVVLISGCGNTVSETPTTDINTTEHTIVETTEIIQKTEEQTTDEVLSSTEKITEENSTTETTTEQQAKPITEPSTAPSEYCYVTIICNAINENIKNLKKEKQPFVPDDGVLLKDVVVEIKNGDTAFDVIKKACEDNTCKAKCTYCQKNGIQIEYTYTPAFDTYYIKGIHQIYEKDCGMQSGWMYSVNGTFPNIGSSSYEVKSGDKVVFAYTCNMGEDIGNIY